MAGPLGQTLLQALLFIQRLRLLRLGLAQLFATGAQGLGQGGVAAAGQGLDPLVELGQFVPAALFTRRGLTPGLFDGQQPRRRLGRGQPLALRLGGVPGLLRRSQPGGGLLLARRRLL